MIRFNLHWLWLFNIETMHMHNIVAAVQCVSSSIGSTESRMKAYEPFSMSRESVFCIFCSSVSFFYHIMQIYICYIIQFAREWNSNAIVSFNINQMVVFCLRHIIHLLIHKMCEQNARTFYHFKWNWICSLIGSGLSIMSVIVIFSSACWWVKIDRSRRSVWCNQVHHLGRVRVIAHFCCCCSLYFVWSVRNHLIAVDSIHIVRQTNCTSASACVLVCF